MTILRRAFTLIELLVSIAIGMALVALSTSALLHVSKVFNRNIAQTQARDDAGAIHQRLRASFSAMYHAAQIYCRTDPGESPASWNNGNEVIELTWMSSVGDLDEDTMDALPYQITDLVWNRLRWTGRGENLEGGRLDYARSSPVNVSQDVSNIGTVQTCAQPRRDRRRDMNDNDLRYLPGMDGANTTAMTTFTALALPGNSTDLNQRLRRMHPPQTQVTRFAVEWVDEDGHTVRADAQSGITLRDAAGVVQPSPGQPFANDRIWSIDGTWLDGRPWVSPGGTRLASGQRPVLMRISFELVPANQEQPEDLSREPHLPFVFTFRVAPTLPRL